MADPGQRRGFDWDKYPRWVTYVPGLLGGAWLIGGLTWILWARILPSDMTVLAKAAQAGICLGGIAFAISGLWPSPGQGSLRPGDITDFWSFVRGGPPQEPYLRGLHRKFRRSLMFLFITAGFMVAWAIVAGLGWAQPR